MFVALLFALAAETAPAETPAPAQSVPAQAAAPAKAKDDGLVCRYEEVVGTRFKKKICRSQAEIAQRRKDDQDRVRENQRPGATRYN